MVLVHMKFKSYIGIHASALARQRGDTESHTQLFPYAFAELLLK